MTGEDVAEEYLLSAAIVAVTKQLPDEPVAVSVSPTIEQFPLVTTYEMAPVPSEPELVRVEVSPADMVNREESAEML